MPGWFDIDHLDESSFMKMMKGQHQFDPDGTDESVKYVMDLIDQEVAAGIPTERIVLGGFSQGGHVALKTLFEKELKLAGCLALSTWIEPQLKMVRSVLLSVLTVCCPSIVKDSSLHVE